MPSESKTTVVDAIVLGVTLASDHHIDGEPARVISRRNLDRLLGIARNREDQARDIGADIDEDDEYEALMARDEAIDAALAANDVAALDAALALPVPR